MKRFMQILACAASCVGFTFSVHADDSDVVTLKRAHAIQWVGGGQSGYSTNFEVRVKRLGSGARVFIHYESNGQWRDRQLTFAKNYKNYDLYTGAADLSQSNGRPGQFAVRYEVNGRSYWNNNDGANYRVDTWKTIIGENVVMKEMKLNVYGCPGWMGNCSFHNIEGEIYVKNLSYDKDVGFRCSYDNGATWFDLDANYDNGLADNVEIWRVNVTRTLNTSFNGAEWRCAAFYNSHWDNNFSQNYLLKYGSGNISELK